MQPTFVPLIYMLTKGIGSFVLESVTFPIILVMGCATETKGINVAMKKINVFMNNVKVIKKAVKKTAFKNI